MRNQLTHLFLLSLVVGCGGRSLAPESPDGDADADADADADGDADGDSCLDADEDGFGVGVCPADCDDLDPELTDDCGESPLCEEGVHRTGCPCELVEIEACYLGPDGTEGQSTCEAGVRRCVANLWGPCEGQTLPGVEECNFVDDDCDGEIDEEAGCPPCSGTGHECFGPDVGCTRWGDSPGLDVTEAGWLTVAPDSNGGAWSTPLNTAGCTNALFEAVLDADATDDAPIRIAVRMADLEAALADAEWLDVATLPPDGPELFIAEVAHEQPAWVELRTSLEGGTLAPPIVRRVDVCWTCEF